MDKVKEVVIGLGSEDYEEVKKVVAEISKHHDVSQEQALWQLLTWGVQGWNTMRDWTKSRESNK